MPFSKPPANIATQNIPITQGMQYFDTTTWEYVLGVQKQQNTLNLIYFDSLKLALLKICKTQAIRYQYEEFLYPHTESINTIFYKLFIPEYFRTPSKSEITNR